MKSRYCYNTCVFGKVGRKVTLLERFHQWKAQRRREKECFDVFPIAGCYRPIYPGK